MNLKQTLPFTRLLARILPLLIAIAFSQTSVQAHHLPPGFEEVDEFEHSHAMLSGLQHPLTGWDHCLALLAIGCAAVLSARKPGLLPAMFFSALAVGGGLGAVGVALPEIPLAAAALVAAGIAVSLRKRSTFLALASATAAFGLWQGNAHAMLITLPQAMVGYAFGFMISSAALMAAGGLLALGMQRLPSRATRLAGTAAAVMGVASLALQWV
jgi:urease accessory protein